MRKVLVVGYGSIGKRHSNAYKELSASVALVTGQSLEKEETYKTISLALKQFHPDVVIVSNDTSSHEKSLNELNNEGFKGIVVVEKPLGEKPFTLKHNFSNLIVSYNLRMSPILKRLKQELGQKKIISANIYCGQYLPDWRPGRDYRDIYSAKKNQGGGVLRDLSHELDYSLWILGKMKNVVALGGHFSPLEIETDDVFTLLGDSEKCPSVTISVNYLDRVARRNILIHSESESYYADLVQGKLLKNNEILLENIKTVDTYIEQAKCVLNNDLESFCTFDEGLSTMKLIEAAEESYEKKRFISL